MKLSEAAELFLGKYRNRNTRRAYQRDLTHLGRYIGFDLTIDTLTPFDAQRALNGMIAFRNPRNGEPLSVHTINKFIKSMRVFFNWCVKMDCHEVNIFAGVDYLDVTDKEASVLTRSMPNEDYLKVLFYFAGLAAVDPERYQRPLALFHFIGNTGTRRAGAAGLTWSQVDLQQMNAVTYEKGGKYHQRDFFEETARVLSKWQTIQTKQAQAKDHYFADPIVFSRYGDPITGPALGQYFRRCCKRAGLRQTYGPHALRHTYGLRLQDAGVPTHLAAKVMGHSPKTFEKHYGSTDDARRRSAASQAQISLENRPKIRPKIQKLEDL